MNLSAPLLVIAAGGTGGHMFPAQALAETMLARGWRVKLSTDARGARGTARARPRRLSVPCRGITKRATCHTAPNRCSAW